MLILRRPEIGHALCTPSLYILRLHDPAALSHAALQPAIGWASKRSALPNPFRSKKQGVDSLENAHSQRPEICCPGQSRQISAQHAGSSKTIWSVRAWQTANVDTCVPENKGLIGRRLAGAGLSYESVTRITSKNGRGTSLAGQKSRAGPVCGYKTARGLLNTSKKGCGWLRLDIALWWLSHSSRPIGHS